MIWFSGCSHFGHKSIFLKEYADRPWTNVDDMDDALIENWNQDVEHDDELYHMGDFTLGKWDQFIQYAWRLNGRIWIVPGNHDWRWMKESKDRVAYSASGIKIEILPPLYTLKIPTDRKHPLPIVLCHYPLRTWDKSPYGSYQLYSHPHGRLPGQGRSMDVGVDANDYRPVSLETVIEKLSQKRNSSELKQ